MIRNISIILIISLAACASTPPPSTTDGTSIDVTSDDKADSATRTLTKDVKAHWLAVSKTLSGMTKISSSSLPGPTSKKYFTDTVAMAVQAYRLHVDGQTIYAVWSDIDGDPIDIAFYSAADHRLCLGEGNDFSNVWHWYR
jgi:hypothetical protein